MQIHKASGPIVSVVVTKVDEGKKIRFSEKWSRSPLREANNPIDSKKHLLQPNDGGEELKNETSTS